MVKKRKTDASVRQAKAYRTSHEGFMSELTDDPIVVFMTAPHREEAVRLADMLVGAHLAACVQILPEMESVYRWQGNIERQTEILLIAKTTRSKFDELEREVRALHSYETPEIIALPMIAGSQSYIDWLTKEG
jgi:periplasmic divalent cation tolerance protein